MSSPTGSPVGAGPSMPPAFAISHPSEAPDPALPNSNKTTTTTQQQYQQSKRSVLFERASPSWWTVRFDSDILERQHWRSLYSHSKRRFRAALAYVLLASLAWLVYFVALQPGAAWLPFAGGCLLIGLTSLAILVMSYMQVFLRHAWWLPTWYAILLCCTVASMVVFRNDNLSPITVFCTFVNVLLLLYTVFPLSLGTCAGIGIVFTCVIAVLNIIFHDEHLDEHTFVLPTLLKLILMLLVHVVGVALYVSSQARLRSTFLKVAQSILAKHELGQEKTFVERMIHSVMPPNVAQQIMAGQLQDRRLSSNASVLQLKNLNDDDDDDYRQKKKKKKSKFNKRRSRGSSCVSSSAAKAAAAMFADPVSQVGGPGGGSPTYGGGGHGGGGSGGPRGGAAGPSIFRPYHMTVMENVSILFADVVGFTAMSSNKTAEQLVNLLNDLFGRFDMLCPKFNCEKISILGDCYYCVSGCPVARSDHAVNCVEMGLGMIDAIGDFCRDRGERVQMRVGVHTGSVLAGIVGHKRFKFDVFSNDVTLANKMESTGQPGKVHISEKTYEALLPEQRQLFIMEDGPRVDTVNTMFVLRKRTVASNKRRYPASAPALDQLEQGAAMQPMQLGNYYTPANNSIENETDRTSPATAAAVDTEEERPKSSSRKRKDTDSDLNGKKSSNHSERDGSGKTRLTPPRQTMLPSFQKPRTHKSSASNDSTNRVAVDASSSSLNSAGSSNEADKSAVSASTSASMKAKKEQKERELREHHERVGSFKREGSFKANRRPSLRSQLMEAQLIQNATKILSTDISTMSTGELISRRTSNKSTSQSPPPNITTVNFFNSSGGSNSNSTVSHGKREELTAKSSIAEREQEDGSLATSGSSIEAEKPAISSHKKASQQHADLRPSPSRSEGTQNSGRAAAVAAAAATGLLAAPGSPGGSRLERKRTSLKGNYSWPGHEEVTIPLPGEFDDETLTPHQLQQLQKQADYAAAVAAATATHRGSADSTVGAALGNSSRRGSRKSGSPLANAADFAASDKSRRLMATDFRPGLQPMQSISSYSATTPVDVEGQQFARAAAAVGNMPGLQRQYDTLAAGAAASQQHSPASNTEAGRRSGNASGGKSALAVMRRDSVFAGNIPVDDTDDEDCNSADALGGNVSADSDADDPRDAPRVRYDKLLVRLMKYHSREVGEDYFSNPPLRPISLNFLDDDLEHAYRHNFAGRHVGTWTDNSPSNQMNAVIDDNGENERLWQHEHHYYYEPNNANVDHSNTYAMTAMDNTRNPQQQQNGGAQSDLPPPNKADGRSPSTSTSIFGGDNVRTFSSNKFNTFIDLLVSSVLLSVIIAVCIVVASAAYLSMPFLIIMPLAIALQIFVLLPSAYLIYQPTLTDGRKQSTVTISMDEPKSSEHAAEDVEIGTASNDESAERHKQQLRRERAERRRRRSSNFLQRLSKYFYWNQTWYARHAVGAVLMLLPCAVVWSTFNCEQLCKLMEPCDANIFFCLALFTAFLNFCNFAQLSSWLRTGLAAVVCLVFVLMVSFNICSTFGASGCSAAFNSAASTVSPTIWTLPSRFNASNRQLAAAARAASTAAIIARGKNHQQADNGPSFSSADYNDFTTLHDNEYDGSNSESAVQRFSPKEKSLYEGKSRVKRFLFDIDAAAATSEQPAELFIDAVKPMTRDDDDDVAVTGTQLQKVYETTDKKKSKKTPRPSERDIEQIKRKREYAPGARAAVATDDYDFVSRTSAPLHAAARSIISSGDGNSNVYTSSSFITTQQQPDRKEKVFTNANDAFFATTSSGNNKIFYAENASRSNMVMNIKDFITHNNNVSHNNSNHDDKSTFGIRSSSNEEKETRTEKNKKLTYTRDIKPQQQQQQQYESEHSRDKSITLNKKWISPAADAAATAAARPTETAFHYHNNDIRRIHDVKAAAYESEKSRVQWARAAAKQSAPPAAQRSLSCCHDDKGQHLNVSGVGESDGNSEFNSAYDDNYGHRPTQSNSAAGIAATPSEFIMRQATLIVDEKTTAEVAQSALQNGRDFVSKATTLVSASPKAAFLHTHSDEERNLADADKVENSIIGNEFFSTNSSSQLLLRVARQATDAGKPAIAAAGDPPVAVVNAANNCLRYFADIIMIDERTLREGRGVVDQEAWYWRLFHHASPVQYEAIFDALLLLILISFLNRESEIIYRLSFHADSLATRDRETILEMKTQADLLLHNIIPQPVVAKLKETNGQYSENMSNAAMIFASVTNFSGLYAEDYAHGREFLRFLNELIGDFDSLLDKPEFKPYVHKIKTIGATYMAAAFPATALANKPSPAPGGGAASGGGGANLGVSGGGKRTSQAMSVAGGTSAQYRSQLSSQHNQPRASMPGDLPIPRVFPSADTTRSITSSSPSKMQRPGSASKSPLQSPTKSPSLMFSDAGVVPGGLTPKRGSGDAGQVDESRLHQYALMDFAIALQDTVREFNKDMLQYEFKIRIGYNIGEVTAGVLGTQKMYFDIWGDAVNLASRMDSTGVNGEIQVEEGCMKQLEDMYEFRPREGGVYVKGKGEMKTDFLVQRRPKRLPKTVLQPTTSSAAVDKSASENPNVPRSGGNFTITNL